MGKKIIYKNNSNVAALWDQVSGVLCMISRRVEMMGLNKGKALSIDGFW